MWKLDPYIDDEGLLRVGGRIIKSNFNDAAKHPIILPKSGPIVRRIIEHENRRIQHGGRSSTTNALRCSGYWVLSNSTNIRSVIHRCIQCRRFRGKLGEQKMANLPPERTATTAPFTHCGVDMFGPFNVKEKRAERKRFVALFTCFSSRAIHLEITSNMDTDSFILALRRFLAGLGAVASIRSDNGKTLSAPQTNLNRRTGRWTMKG